MKTLVLLASLLVAVCAMANEVTNTIVVPPDQPPAANRAEKEDVDKCSQSIEDFTRQHEEDLEGWRVRLGKMGEMIDATRLWGEPKKATVIRVNNAPPAEMARLLDVFDAEIVPQPEFNAIAVKADPDTLATIEELVKRFDVPLKSPANVELQFYLLVQEDGHPVPPQLASVIEQIRKIYPDINVAVFESSKLRGCDNEEFSFRNSDTRGRQIEAKGRVSVNGSTIKLEEFSYEVGPDGKVLGLQTDISFEKGQSVVIGNTNMEGYPAFLVVTGDIVQ